LKLKIKIIVCNTDRRICVVELFGSGKRRHFNIFNIYKKIKNGSIFKSPNII